jgi:hypothetical protein
MNSTSTKASLPSTFYRALDKDFAECQSVLGKEKRPSRRQVTETATLPSVLGDTRQRSYLFVECLRTCTQQRIHQRVPLSGSLSSALCGTWQSVPLCRVPGPQHSAKKLYRCPGIASLSSAMALTLGTEALDKACSAECQTGGTRQSLLCRMSNGGHSAKKILCRVLEFGSRQR